MTSPRIVVAGATTAITRRCNLRKAFLAPWHPEVTQCWLYSLAWAQQRTGVALHMGQLVVSHEHLDATPSRSNLPVFNRYVHRELSCALNALLCRERYDAPREVFDGRGPHCMRLLDAPAQASHLLYEYLNCVAAGLVRRPEDMPSHTFDFRLWKRGYVDVHRPSVYFDPATRPEVLRLEVTPPPLLLEAFSGDLDRLVYHMQREADRAAQHLRAAHTRPVLGARGVRRLHPWSEPASLRESGGELIPSFKIGARGIVGQQDHIRAAEEVRGFRALHGETRRARRRGDMAARYPHGTYAARVLHDAPVNPPAPDSWVTAPGPLLADVQVRCGGSPAAEDRVPALLKEVGDAFADEAEQVYEATVVDIASTATAGRTRSAGTPADDPNHGELRPAATVRHRLDRRHEDRTQQAGEHAARRIVVLRDKRRGRSPKPQGDTHNSDPPR